MYPFIFIQFVLFLYQILCCLNKKGLNSSGSQNTPLNTKLNPKFRLLFRMLGFLLPNTVYNNPVETAMHTDRTGSSPTGSTNYLLNVVIQHAACPSKYLQNSLKLFHLTVKLFHYSAIENSFWGTATSVFVMTWATASADAFLSFVVYDEFITCNLVSCTGSDLKSSTIITLSLGSTTMTYSPCRYTPSLSF